MRTFIACTAGKAGICRRAMRSGNRIAAAISVALPAFLGEVTAMQIIRPATVAAEEVISIDEFYNSSEPFEDEIKNARLKRVMSGTKMPVAGLVPYYTKDDWFRSYDNPSIRIQVKKIFRKRNDFDFDGFDKYLRSNKKHLYRIYFYSDDGYISMQFVNDGFIDNITIPVASSAITEFLN